MSLQKTQLALIEEGYFLGTSGSSGKDDDGVLSTLTRRALEAYQRLHRLPITGEDDKATRWALFDDDKPEPPAEPVYVVDPVWIGGAVKGNEDGVRIGACVLVGWTGGPHEATEEDRERFHVIVQGDGSLVGGDQAPSADSSSDVITVAAACSAETMTREQWNRLAAVAADLCERFELPITPKTVFSWAEAPEEFPGAEDISRLAFDLSVTGAKSCGDALRARAIEIRLDGR